VNRRRAGRGCGARGRFGAALLVLAASVLAALLWSRLKLVTGIPRTAFAGHESEKQRPAGPR
jgi:hypothetical protein